MGRIKTIWLHVKDFFARHIGHYKISPLFLAMLALSFILWYVSKLQYTYTAEIPVSVSVEGDRHRVTCVVQGSGHNILSSLYFNSARVKLKRYDVDLIPVDGLEDTYEVTPESLLNALSIRNSDIKIISVSRMPYVTIED